MCNKIGGSLSLILINMRFFYLITLTFALIFVSPSVLAQNISPFITDGCSSFPDGTVENIDLWTNCCIAHDFSYWKGGTYEQRLDAEKAGAPNIAKLMLFGVRVGGTPYSPMYYRWGYGWPYLRGYKPITDSEKQEIRKKLDQFRETINSLSKSLDTE